MKMGTFSTDLWANLRLNEPFRRDLPAALLEDAVALGIAAFALFRQVCCASRIVEKQGFYVAVDFLMRNSYGFLAQAFRTSANNFSNTIPALLPRGLRQTSPQIGPSRPVGVPAQLFQPIRSGGAASMSPLQEPSSSQLEVPQE
jgi:hypothetical protein